MLTTTLLQLFKDTFSRGRLLQWARELGAVKRLRAIHPLDFCVALVDCALGDEERSIATARRLFGKITHFTPEESSFYDRFTDGMVNLMRKVFSHLLDQLSSVQRDVVAAALGGKRIVDILAVDATQAMLPAAAAEVLPSTDEDHGGFKLTAVLSVMYQRLQEVVLTDARTHDRMGLRLPRWMRGLLYLFDRGYSDFRLFATIEDRKGLFVTKMKKSFTPIIKAIRSGLGQAHLGNTLTDALPFRGIVDIDAEFRVRGKGRRTFRVVRITVDGPCVGGRRQQTHVWLITNLRPEDFTAEQVAILYRLRWEVELLFKTLKTVGRLDQLRSASLSVIQVFICATLIGILLAHETCAQMRRAPGKCEPSAFRVAALVLAWLPEIVQSLGTNKQRPVMEAFAFTLWREGTNPNPGRPYMATRYAQELRELNGC
jgi:putative transposase